jgi:hypothetical protein
MSVVAYTEIKVVREVAVIMVNTPRGKPPLIALHCRI